MHRNLILFILITISFIASCEEGFDLNTGITLSENNELYALELNVSNNVTDDLSPVHFNAKVKRHEEYNISSDSRILGSWSLHSLTIDDSITSNVAQFPTDYLFYADQTFDKTDISTVGGEDLYSNGVWTADKNAGGLTTSMAGETNTINYIFDHSGFFIPMDGFMVWNYDKDNHSYRKILQKTSPPDPAYLSISSSGGIIESLTEPSAFDILIQLSNDDNASYEVSGSFVPGLNFTEGNILATLSGGQYSIININIPISIEIIY
jgi:hypothetical protein